MGALRLILAVLGLWLIAGACFYSARAAVEPVRPEVKQELPRTPPKHKPARCMKGTPRPVGIWIMRDRDGNVLAVGAVTVGRKCR